MKNMSDCKKTCSMIHIINITTQLDISISNSCALQGWSHFKQYIPKEDKSFGKKISSGVILRDAVLSTL
jgi:hypothetical protein